MTTTLPPKITPAWLLIFCITLLMGRATLAQQDLSAAAGWTLHPSHEAVKATLAPATAAGGGAGFTLSYNFTAGSGFIIARHEFADGGIDLPDNYEVSFTLTGSGPSNNLEVKLLDAPDGKGSKLGDSVWWINRRNFEWPGSPTRINNKVKQFQFAWGPLNGAKIKKLGAIEVVVASSSGGQGTITVTDVRFRPLPPSTPYTGTPVAAASSSLTDHAPALALDGNPESTWLDDDNLPAELTIDFGRPRDLDALRIDWATPTASYTVEASDDAARWQSLWTAQSNGEGVRRSYADIPDTTARYLRVVIDKPNNGQVGIADVRFLTRPESADNLGIWRLIAADLPQSAMPRYFSGRQSTWTVIGSPASDDEALINEEGEVEVCRSGPMLSAMVVRNGVGNSEAWTSATQRMRLDGAPTAVVEMRNERLSLAVSTFAWSSQVMILYELECISEQEKGELALCMRPFQVNPPWQFLNSPGGAARVRSIEPDGSDLLVNGLSRVLLPSGDRRVSLMTFADGEAGAAVATGSPLPARAAASDPKGFASAAVLYPFSLKRGERASWVVRLLPHSGPRKNLDGERPLENLTPRNFENVRADYARSWGRLNAVTLNLPPGNEQLVASIRASLAYILVNKDGAGFQPGSRSYERSWIRDGSLTGAALLEFGLTDDVKGFIDWYAGYQFPSGGIPCVVDKRGADPVTENDSHGQFIYALAEYYRYTRDDAFLLKHFDAVEKTVNHIQAERAKRMTPEYTGDSTRSEPGKSAVPIRAFFGLMPESISHEGYSSKPMHSYWDDFFTLKGLRDAAFIARELKKEQQAMQWTADAADLAKCIKDSITLAQQAHGISYIPGCPELGDFDATSTTIAINPCGALNDLPRAWYDATFEKWWNFFSARRDGTQSYIDYTPYEWRIVGAQVMLGQRDRAWQSTKWYMQDQNPPRKPGDTSASGWLHWAEIVHNDRGAGKWIGDMPHTWVASDFLRSIRTMLVYEEPTPAPTLSNLVLFAGVPAEWADAPGGVSFTGLRTPYGPLNASLKKQDGWYVMHYDGLDANHLPYRVRFAPPVAWPPKEFEILEGGGSQDNLPSGVNGITTGMTIRFR